MTPTATRPLFRLRNRHLFLLDTILLCLAPAVALTLRIDYLHEYHLYLPALATYTAYALLIRLSIFWLAGFYCRYWRYASYDDLLLLVKGNLLATVILLALFWMAWQAWDGTMIAGDPARYRLPRSVPIIDAALVFGAVAGIRFTVRSAKFRHVSPHTHTDAIRRVLIMGAGDAGAMVGRDMLDLPRLGMLPVGYVDDDPEKRGMRLHGIPILGSHDHLAEFVRQTRASLVVIAMPSAAGKVVREIVRQCEDAGVPARIVPSMHALLDGTVSVQQLREVQIDDLLRREPVHVDTAAVTELIHGRRVLVTGGGGSIGSELCRQVLRCGPTELVVLGHGENSIFEIMSELRPLAARCGTTLRSVIADVRFAARINAVFAAERPEVVFHAAAHKHVPLMEENPGEAITNNVQGTANVVDAAMAAGVRHFVLISTDKAVNPSSVMGASKRVAELIVRQAAQQSGLPYVAVRFGNVLGSRGSVVLTFKRQIAAGGPVTVTHPEMKRFFMTIPEAVQLVLQAATLGKGGEVFMLDMGEAVKIVDLAHDLIELSGLRVGRDIDIAYNGVRPGEKLEEELFITGEQYGATRHAKIFTADGRNAVGACRPAELDARVAQLVNAAYQGDRADILTTIRQLVPEFEAPEPGTAIVPAPRSAPIPARPAPAKPVSRPEKPVLGPAFGD